MKMPSIDFRALMERARSSITAAADERHQWLLNIVIIVSLGIGRKEAA